MPRLSIPPSPDEVRNIRKACREIRLGEFQQDVFLSYRDETHTPAILFKNYIQQNGWRAYVMGEGEPYEYAQDEEIDKSRAIAVLLPSRGCVNDQGDWGQQYNEIQRAVQIRNAINAIDPEMGVYCAPLFLILFFHSESTQQDFGDSPKEIVDALFPKFDLNNPDALYASNSVRQALLANTTQWTFLSPADTESLDGEPPWAPRAQTALSKLFKRFNRHREVERQLEDDPIPLSNGTRDSIQFDPNAYLASNRSYWEKGSSHSWVAGDDDESVANADPEWRTMLRNGLILRGSIEHAGSLDDNRQVSDTREWMVGVDRWMVIYGVAGSGKSTLIAHAAATEAEDWRPSDSGGDDPAEISRFPFVFVAKRLVRRFEAGCTTITEAMALEASGRSTIVSEAAFSQWIEAPTTRCSIYIDGVDEVSDAHETWILNEIDRLELRWRDANVRLVLTCRSGWARLNDDESFADFARVRLQSLKQSDLETVFKGASRRSVIRAFRQAFENDQQEDAGLLRTPFMVRLIEILHRAGAVRSDINGAGPIIFMRAIAKYVEKALESASGDDLGDFDAQAALTILARRVVLSQRSPLTLDDLDDAAKVGLDDLSRSAAEKQLNLRLGHLTNTSILRAVDADDARKFTFQHDLIAEYLVAEDFARMWRNRLDASGEADKTLLAMLENINANRFAPLVDRIPCAIALDPADKIAVSSASAMSFFEATLTVFESAGDGSLVSGNSAVLGLSRLWQAVLALQKERLFKLKASERLESTVRTPLIHLLQRRIGELPIRTRELRLRDISLSDISLWRRVSGCDGAPVRFGSDPFIAPDWSDDHLQGREIVPRPITAEVKPVTVKEYEQFAGAVDRYDHKYWPHRTAEQQDQAEDLLIGRLKSNPKFEFRQTTTVASDDLVGPDVSGSTLNDTYEYWRAQARWPGRPVTMVTWFEAEAYARWLSDQSGESYVLPSYRDWLNIAVRSRAVETSELGDVNVRKAGLYRPSTIGAFPPSELGLFDFGSNVSIWLSEYDLVASGATVDSNNSLRSHRAHYIGPHYNSARRWSGAETTHKAVARWKRYPRVGIWLIRLCD